MLTDYKFWYIRRDDDGFITEAAVRFYEGEITTKNEKQIDDVIKPVTRYRRSKKLQDVELDHLNKPKIKDSGGSDAVLYTSADFGQIKSDNELRLFLNQELSKDKIRTPIPEQSWQP